MLMHVNKAKCRISRFACIHGCRFVEDVNRPISRPLDYKNINPIADNVKPNSIKAKSELFIVIVLYS